MSKISSSEQKMLNLQLQMKENNRDLQNFLTDLDSWETDIKDKETKLKENKSSEGSALPPVRNSLDKKKLKKRVKKKKDSKPKRISGYDYRSWDKFNVDEACASSGTSEEEYETDEEWESERKKQAAVLEKDKGNEYFKKGDYERAIECYTKGADLDPTNPLLPANRAMAFIKQDKFGAAELDCSVALSLDPLYTKAYLRRGTARLGLKKYEEAQSDYQKVLQLEPQNKKAKSDLELIDKELAKLKMVTHTDVPVDTNRHAGIVRAITKPPHQRSKKPLKRIEIEEVGVEDDSERQAAISKTLSAQSDAKKNIVQRDGLDFQRFTATSPADIARLASQGRDNEEGKPSAGQGDGNISVNGAAGAENTMANIPNGIDGSDKHITVTSSKQTNCDTRVNSSTAASVGEHKAEKSVISNRANDSNKVEEKKSNKSSSRGVNKVDSKTASSSDNSVDRASDSGNTTGHKLNMPVPVTSVQFQADFRQLKNDIPAFYEYFKRIEPRAYCKLFGQFFDADVLLTILKVIQQCYIWKEEDCYDCLKCLTEVKRFSMVTMFLSNKDKQALNDIFSIVRAHGKHSEADLKALAAKYDVR